MVHLTELITCTTGESFEISLPEPADIRSFFAFSLPKAGSTLLDNLLIDCCERLNIPNISPFRSAWEQGISPTAIDVSVESIFLKRGYAYIGFRHYFAFIPTFDFTSVNNILLVRDPKDMLTSLYFSLKFSHTFPEVQGSATETIRAERNSIQNQDINDFVLERTDFYLTNIRAYLSMIPSDRLRIYRYEDIIYDKFAWLSEMLQFLDLRLPTEDIEKIAKKHDIRPETEDPHAHIRQVTPGNHKKHLSPLTINELNRRFEKELQHLGYLN